MHDEHHHIDPQFDYRWASRHGAKEVTISMKRRPIQIDIEKDGIRTSFDVQAEKATKWQCGDRTLPHLPLNPAYKLWYLGCMVLCRILPPTISTRTCSDTQYRTTCWTQICPGSPGSQQCSNSTWEISTKYSPSSRPNTTPMNL